MIGRCALMSTSWRDLEGVEGGFRVVLSPVELHIFLHNFSNIRGCTQFTLVHNFSNMTKFTG